MTGILLPNLVLPTLTKVRHHTKYTNLLTCVDAYQMLPDPMLAMLKPLVILDWSTIAYHFADLALLLPRETFTNLYHRGLGQGIKPNAPFRVGQYRRGGCHMGSRVEGYRSR